MRYPIVIETGQTAISVTVPDLPGCVFAAETLDAAIAGAEVAAAAWIDAALDNDQAIPRPSSLEALREQGSGAMYGVISLDPALLDDAVERVNISLPRRVLRRLDLLARAAGKTRSGYIAHLALREPVAEAPRMAASGSGRSEMFPELSTRADFAGFGGLMTREMVASAE